MDWSGADGGCGHGDLSPDARLLGFPSQPRDQCVCGTGSLLHHAGSGLHGGGQSAGRTHPPTRRGAAGAGVPVRHHAPGGLPAGSSLLSE